MTAVRDALLKLVGEAKPMQVISCKVVSVDQSDHTCTVQPADGSPEFHAVRLRSTIDNSTQGIIVIPKVGSYVLVGAISDIDNYRFVMMYDQVEKVQITCDDIRLNGDQFLGMAKVQELYNAISRLETAIKDHQHIYVDGPGVGPLLTQLSPATPALVTPPTTLNQLKNDKVKHG